MFYHRFDSTHERRVELEKMRDERRPNRKIQHCTDFQRGSRSENTHFAILETQNLPVRGFQENWTRLIKNPPDTSVRQVFKFISLGNKAFYSTFSIYFHTQYDHLSIV